MSNFVNKESAKSIFIANVKGGVGKSTLSIMLARALASNLPQNITVIDTDLQRTTTEFLSASNQKLISSCSNYPAFENTNIALLQQFIKQNSFKNGHIVIIDTPWTSTSLEFSRWKLLVLIPTSLSNADLAPTESFIKSMDKVKARYNQIYPHLVVCPNKIPFGQKDYSTMAKRLSNHDVVIGPAIRDLASVDIFTMEVIKWMLVKMLVKILEDLVTL